MNMREIYRNKGGKRKQNGGRSESNNYSWYIYIQGVYIYMKLYIYEIIYEIIKRKIILIEDRIFTNTVNITSVQMHISVYNNN